MHVDIIEKPAPMKRIIFIATIAIFILAPNYLIGQPRANYPVLHSMNRAPSSFLDQFYLPGLDNNTEVNFIFRINYDKLNFRRDRSQANGVLTENFVSEIELIFDLYEKDIPLIPDRAFLARESWSATVNTTSYEDTQSDERYIEGFVKMEIAPDEYRLITTLLVNGQEIPLSAITSSSTSMQMQQRRPNRRESREAAIQRGTISVPKFSSANTGSILLLDSKKEDGSFNLMNLGNNVKYAHDFYLLGITNSDTQFDSLVVKMFELGPILANQSENTRLTWSANLSSDGTTIPSFEIKSDSNRISLVPKDTSATYDLKYINVPNRKFKNSWYRFNLVGYVGGNETILTQKNVLTRWFDIPTSLLNLDVALDNMKYIADETTIKELKRGNVSEKEAKFRAFWKEKDPT
ncbi:MAG TPA: hypothetical protein DCE78_02740, partial [Bacteroidetes bacterium]|nr:hypothetical protein [Bacteroidota bacterium]